MGPIHPDLDLVNAWLYRSLQFIAQRVMRVQLVRYLTQINLDVSVLKGMVVSATRESYCSCHRMILSNVPHTLSHPNCETQ